MLFKILKTKRKTGEEQDESSAHQTPQDKANARRPQVRKAQIEHRQRKANYVKQLEMDVARIRDMIAASQTDIRSLQAENDAIRSQLAAEAVPPPQSILPNQEAAAPELPEAVDMSLDPMQLDNLDGVILTLGLDEVMNLPVYQITSEPTSSLYPPDTYSDPSGASESPGLPYCPFGNLNPEQTQQAINFILALEHICWDHFRPSNFDHEAAELSGKESGHTLMASSLALRTAPAAVFDAMAAQPVSPPGPPSGLAARAAAKSEGGAATPPPPVSWPASGLTLHSLYGLASSVNPSDLELAPVQAWFELAARWPLETLLRKDVEDRLKTAFVGVVKCPHYGAAIERGAFESICARVLGPEVAVPVTQAG